MEKKPSQAKIVEALSALADQRVQLQATSAQVESSDRTKAYTVRFDGDLYTSNDNATLWQHYPGYPILAVLMLQRKLIFSSALLPEFAGVVWKQLNRKHKNNYDQAVEEFLSSKEASLRVQIEEQIQQLDHQLELMELTVKGNRVPLIRPDSAAQPK